MNDVTEMVVAMFAGFKAAVDSTNGVTGPYSYSAQKIVYKNYKAWLKAANLKVSRNGGPLKALRADDRYKAGNRFYQV